MYDAYNAYQTVKDPRASSLDKRLAVGGLAASILGPGGGYGTIGKNVGKRVAASVGKNVGKKAAASAGTYYLIDPITGQIVRTGRTNNLRRRMLEHERDPELEGLEFMIDMVIPNNRAALRGREQIIFDATSAPYNKIGGIDPRHPRRRYYLNEAAKLGVGPLGF